MNKDKKQEHLNLFNHYIQGLNEIKKDLEKIKKITNLEEKYNESSCTLRKHVYNHGYACSHFNNGKLYELGISSVDTLDEYDKLIRELREIDTEALKKLKSTQCAYCQTKSLLNSYNWNEKSFCNQVCLKEYLAPCSECEKSRYGANWQKAQDNDGKRFCSKKCFSKHYNSQTEQKTNGQSSDLSNNQRERERERERNTDLWRAA